MDPKRRDRIAQWAFDTASILGRFHLWLEDVEESWPAGEEEGTSFAGASLDRAFIMSVAVTALGTRLFGRFGEAAGRDKAAVNRIKKHADAVSAYALSEALWYLTRNLPENHAVMVCLGEGLMPKAGETPEMGSNPLLGFGRVYARPQVARYLDRCVSRLLNEAGYGWEAFWQEVQTAGLTIWGAAIDTLENTSRFAQGRASGPMTVLHLYDQPLTVTQPFEGYVGTLTLPRPVVAHAEQHSVLLTYHTPRQQVLAAIRGAYPDIPAERVHVWTLGGSSRQTRLCGLWEEWQQLGVHVVEEGWELPDGGEAFIDSGTYAPVFRVGTWRDGAGQRHLFLTDGYSASAEAIQAASLDPVLGHHTTMSLFSSVFKLPVERERQLYTLDAEAESFAEALTAIAGQDLESEQVAHYCDSLRVAREAGMPCGQHHISIDDFFPRKRWRVLALSGFMLPDPYSGEPGVEKVGEGVYRVAVRAATRTSVRTVHLTLRLQETFDESRMVFSPLLERFCAGEHYRERPVKVSDSGRIRNELQTLCSDALEHLPDAAIRVDFDRVEDAVLAQEKKARIDEVLRWYKSEHPVWFRWLEIADL